ncbi:MAG: MFS transporter [Lachnospiraceae bacterium]|nr:MFS transporter [Lachnospiraceae bacterium]
MDTGEKKFGWKDKLGYLFGDFGNDFTFLLSSSFLLKFYTDVCGVSAAVVGLIIMLARFVDAFTDVTMGRICDRSKGNKNGKFKPWIIRMCIPVAISSFLIYQEGIAGLPMYMKILYLSVTYILWGSIFYTSINIPYGSMASTISEKPGDRQSLSTFRSLGGSLAGVIIGAGIPLVAYDTVNGNTVLNGERFTWIAGIFSVLAIICYLLCYFLVTERVRPVYDPELNKRNSLLNMFKNAFTNRALLSIVAASVVMLLAQLTMQTMANYVFPNYYRNTVAQSASTLTMLVAILIAAAFVKPLASRFGKAEISVFANILACAVNILTLIIRPENVWVYVALQFVSWLGLGIFTMANWALITDVIDYSELRNGIREDGAIYAMYSFARKLGQAASAGITGLLLSAIGYSQETAFEKDVVDSIFDISLLVPAAGFALLAIILWFWYPLHKKKVDENVEALRRKRQEEQDRNKA